MATNVLVSDVIEQARVRLHWPSFGASTFWTSTEVLNEVKYSARRLSGILRRAFGSDYFVTDDTLTTSAGINVVSLPANFTDLRKLAWVRSANDIVPMEMMSVDDFGYSGETAQAWAAPRYRLQSEALVLYPTPDAAYTLLIYYDTGIFVSATTDVIAAQPGWEEWLVLDLCIKARQAEEKDERNFQASQAKVEMEIKDQASSRDRYRTHQVRDLNGMGEFVDSRSLYVRR